MKRHEKITDSKNTTKRQRKLVKSEKINVNLYQWYKSRRRRNFPISPANLQDAARKKTQTLNIEYFIAPNG